MYSFNIKAKLTSFTSDVFNHSAHTVLSTASAGLAFGMVGAVVGLGIGIVEAALLYNDIIDTHYLTYATLAVSAASLLGAPILQSAFVSDVIEKSFICGAVDVYFNQSDKSSELVQEAQAEPFVFEYA